MRQRNPSQTCYATAILCASGKSGCARSRRLLALVLTAVVLSVAACSQASATTTTTHIGTPTPTGTPSDALPTFSDWRAAYVSSDGHLQVITFDGKTDLIGPALPNLTPAGLNFPTAGFAPNGHVLAYDANGITIVDVATQPMVEHSVALGGMNALAWSPDSSELAASDGTTVYTVSANGGQPKQIQVQPLPKGWQAVNNQLLGWIDDTHVAVTVVPNGPIYTAPDGTTWVTAVGLGALDVTSGQLRVIATISFPGLANPYFVLSPDGKTALFYNQSLRANPFTPDVELIDTQTGAREQLPRITQATHAGFTAVAWQPGTETIAVSNGDLQSWVLDAQQDRATKLLTGHVVEGWAPNKGPLIVATPGHPESSSGPYDLTGSGPYDLSAVTIAPSGQIATTLLTQTAWTFPLVGFVRTAA